jgi:hypothetical protein
MNQSPDILESGEPARLLPVVKDSRLEDRATSILLAGIMSVRGFAAALLKDIGPRMGKHAHIRCYSQIVLKNTPGQGKQRPDGLIEVAIGSRHWRALVEGRILKTQLTEEQIREYLHLARSNDIDAVITVSNQFASLPSHHPVRFSKPLPKGASLYHWSWMHVVTTATLLLHDEEFEPAEQKYILSELVRYFSHPSSGLTGFDRMNPEWKGVVAKVKTRAALSKTADEVVNTVGSWHQETRDLSLILSRALGAPIRLKLSRAHANDAARRLRDDCEALSKDHQLAATIDIPDAAAPLTIVADLRRRSLRCSMRLEAPKDKKTATARTKWLLRQLRDASSPDIVVNASWPGRSPQTQAALAALREDPKRLEAGKGKLVPWAFEVVVVRDLAGKFAGSKTFIEALEDMVPHFYDQVGQHLRAWVPPPPKFEPKEQHEEDRDEGAHEADGETGEAPPIDRGNA